jgi:hypothetical protein
MDLTMLPSKKTVAKWECKMLMIAQGNSVIELTPDQADELLEFIQLTRKPSSLFRDSKQDLGG